MKEDYVHKDSLTALGYYDFAKTQSIKDNILEYTKDYGRIQFIDEICRLQRENQQLKNALEEYKELLEIKGKYEELKQHPEIKYIYVYDTKPYIENPIKITW